MMNLRFKFLGLLLVFGAILVFSGSVSAQTYDALKWENRVLVLSADENSGQALEQITELRPFVDEMEERELIVLRLNNKVLRKVDGLSPFPFDTEILESRQRRRYLESLFSRDAIGDGGLVVTLVGLDGELKQVWQGAVDPQEIFDAIDAMPMRQRNTNEQ